MLSCRTEAGDGATDGGDDGGPIEHRHSGDRQQCEPANGGDDDGGGGGKTGETAEKMDDEGGNDHIVAMMA